MNVPILHDRPAMENLESAKALMRAARVPDVMVALFRAVKMTDLARYEDIPPDDCPRYRQAAEMAVQLLVDPTLVDAADYFAAEQLHLEKEVPPTFADLPTKQRYLHVLHMRMAIRRWFAFSRGEWPEAIPVYRALAEQDAATIKASNVRTAAQRQEDRRRFEVVEGGK